MTKKAPTKLEQIRAYICSLPAPACAADIAHALGYNGTHEISSTLSALAVQGTISHKGTFWGAPQQSSKLSTDELESIRNLYQAYSIDIIAKTLKRRRETISAAIVEMKLSRPNRERRSDIAERRALDSKDALARTRLARPSFFTAEDDIIAKMRGRRS